MTYTLDKIKTKQLWKGFALILMHHNPVHLSIFKHVGFTLEIKDIVSPYNCLTDNSNILKYNALFLFYVGAL